MSILTSLLLANFLIFPEADVVQYFVSFPNAIHHEAVIEMHLPAGHEKGPLEIRMSRSSPGRYAIHEFAKNVYKVEAATKGGKELAISRSDPYQWNIEDAGDEEVIFTYTLFADRAGGTYSGIDASHAHLNIPATFAWAKGFEQLAIEVHFEPADASWKVATQLHETDNPLTYTAPDLQYFMDSPTELSNHSVRTWTVTDENDGEQTIKLAVHHMGTEQELDDYADMAKKVVQAQIDIFGGDVPPYDGGSYTFIADYLPYVSGDGMEHRNSTILASTRSLKDGAMRNLRTLSHEYFHQWNVERIRPETLEPFDFTRANMSGELWFAEGFTSYYTNIAIRRAGLIGDEEFARGLASSINTVTNSPGRKYFSAVEMSQRAPFRDASSSIDPTNFGNTFISYYTWGSAIALGLDLTLRRDFGLTLDGLMQVLWFRFGEDGKNYTVSDIEIALGHYTNDPNFAKNFFDSYIRGHEVPDYPALLSSVGISLSLREPGGAWLGARLDVVDEGLEIIDYPLEGSSLYEAGLDKGDIIKKVGGNYVSLNRIQNLKAASTISLEYWQRGTDKTSSMNIVQDPSMTSAINSSASKEELERRAFWLNGRLN